MAGGMQNQLKRTCGECAHWGGRTDAKAGVCWVPLPFWSVADPWEMPRLYADDERAARCETFKPIER
jgi:hypothetical protein